PVFYLLGMAIYRLYYYAFESRGEQAIQGLAFFFGLLFVAEVSLVLIFGVDYRFVEAPYIGPSLHFGILDLPLRYLIPFAVSLLIGIVASITATFYGPSWSPAVAFGFLLIALAVRPAGLMGR